MKTIITIIIFLISLGLKSQELYTVTGQIQYLSYYQGGVELPPELMQPIPSPNLRLYVVQYFGPNEITKVISSIKSDDHGNFEVKLPPGKYGFIQNKSEVGKGIFLPGMIVQQKLDTDTINPIEIEFQEIGHQDYWALSSGGPFEITNQDLIKVNLIHYDITICYTCP